jgi:hypothetical protein
MTLTKKIMSAVSRQLCVMLLMFYVILLMQIFLKMLIYSLYLIHVLVPTNNDEHFIMCFNLSVKHDLPTVPNFAPW